MHSASIKGNWLSGLDGQGPEMRRAGCGLCVLYGQLQCAEMVEDWERRGRAGKQYERVVYSRADFNWLGSAPYWLGGGTTRWIIMLDVGDYRSRSA